MSEVEHSSEHPEEGRHGDLEIYVNDRKVVHTGIGWVENH